MLLEMFADFVLESKLVPEVILTIEYAVADPTMPIDVQVQIWSTESPLGGGTPGSCSPCADRVGKFPVNTGCLVALALNPPETHVGLGYKDLVVRMGIDRDVTQLGEQTSVAHIRVGSLARLTRRHNIVWHTTHVRNRNEGIL